MAEAILWAAATYLAAGAVFAVAFLGRAVERLDPRAKGAGVGFRIAILPGVVSLWPLLIGAWRRAR